MAQDGILFSGEEALEYSARLLKAARSLAVCAVCAGDAEKALRAMDPSGESKPLASAQKALAAEFRRLEEVSEDLGGLSRSLSAACDLFDGAERGVLRAVQRLMIQPSLPIGLPLPGDVRWESRLDYTPHPDWLLGRLANPVPNPFQDR